MKIEFVFFFEMEIILKDDKKPFTIDNAKEIRLPHQHRYSPIYGCTIVGSKFIIYKDNALYKYRNKLCKKKDIVLTLENRKAAFIRTIYKLQTITGTLPLVPLGLTTLKNKPSFYGINVGKNVIYYYIGEQKDLDKLVQNCDTFKYIYFLSDTRIYCKAYKSINDALMSKKTINQLTVAINGTIYGFSLLKHIKNIDDSIKTNQPITPFIDVTIADILPEFVTFILVFKKMKIPRFIIYKILSELTYI